MATRIYDKVIISGHVVETYCYSSPVFEGFKSKGGRKKNNNNKSLKSLDRTLEYRKTSSNRAREKLRRLILCNFNEYSKFCTLTFKKNLSSIDLANPLFKKFIMRLKYHLSQKEKERFKYASVIEFQDRGSIHYHMLANLPWMPKNELQKVWGHGNVWIRELGNVDNVGAFTTKYMLKDIGDERLKGKKAYSTSRNLIKPIEIKGQEAAAYQYFLRQKKEVYAATYESEHQGKIEYKEYNIKRNEAKALEKIGKVNKHEQ